MTDRPGNGPPPGSNPWVGGPAGARPRPPARPGDTIPGWAPWADLDAAQSGDPDSTQLLSAVPPAQNAPAPARAPASRPKALIGRFTVTLGGLLGAGCLLVGLGLVVLMVVAPKIGSTGAAATGPGWLRTGLHLGVGIAAEVGRALTVRGRWPIRVAVGAATIVAVIAVTSFSWWR